MTTPCIKEAEITIQTNNISHIKNNMEKLEKNVDSVVNTLYELKQTIVEWFSDMRKDISKERSADKDLLYAELEKLKNRYANKTVEKIVYWMVATILFWVLWSILTLIYK